MISDEAVAWFLMGEGCLSVACRWRQRNAKLISEAYACVWNTDREMIDALRGWLDAKGIKYGFMERPMKNGPIYGVKIRTSALLAFLQKIRPYLVGVKARVADRVLGYFAIPNRTKTTISQRFEKWAKVLDIVEEINRLNRKASISREKHRLHIGEIRSFLEHKRATTWRRPGKNCIRCGRFFEVPPCKMPTAKYCSRPCKYGHMARVGHYSKMAGAREARKMSANSALYNDVANLLEGPGR